jgi:hypothetical protein
LDVLDGVMVRGLMADHVEAEALAEASTRRLAATTVRRAALNHPCGGHLCTHRNHRRDGHHEAFLLEMLDLSGVAGARPSDYAGPVAWGSFSKQDVQLLR